MSEAKRRGWERVALHERYVVYARDGWRIQKQSNGWRWWYVIQVPLVARSPRGVAKTLRAAMNEVDFEIRHGATPPASNPTPDGQQEEA